MKEYIEKDQKFTIKELICIGCMVFVISGIFGWVYEFFFYYINTGFQKFYMRGGNYLPWINIYMYGSFLIIFLTYKRRKKPLQVFLISVVSTGILEYLSGAILYGMLGWTKCWDYNQEILNFGNIGGYVCLRSVLVFGLCGLLLIYGILPVLIKIVKKSTIKILLPITICIACIFAVDEVYNLIFDSYFSLPGAHEYYESKGWEYLYFK